MVNSHPKDRGGPWLPRYGTSRGFSDRISRDYDDLEIPTVMVQHNAHRVFRYADGSIVALFISQQGNHRLEGRFRPRDPDAPNVENGQLQRTWNEIRQPTNQWILTSEGASRMLKSWLERSGHMNLFSIPPGSEVNGQFVGQDADGTTGMIGTWELPEDAFGVGDVRAPIRGSFGAEYAP